MSVKPSTLPRWATGATGIAATTEPASGDKDDGFAVGDRPPAGWFNWLLHTIYLWAEYLSDQVFTGDVTADRFVTTDSDVVHGLRTYVVGPIHFKDTLATGTIGGTGAGGGSFNVPAGSFGEFFVPIDLQLGQRLTQVRVYAETDNTADTDITARISKTIAQSGDVTGSQSYLNTSQPLPGGGGDVQVIIMTTGLPDTVLSGECFELRVNIANTGGGVAKRVYRVEYDVDRPV